ncbi:MAG: beta-ketoacyl synthase N-terminal-like domain-containing protein [Gammaproteobacteria bacterium]|nr:MAG: beta-ketoacyl synthase N-terminal-like domain-containing protein [Gammaproteobacteria bacterium]
MFPQAADLESYWNNILGKVYAVGEPSDSWGAERYYDPHGDSDERTYTKTGGFLRDLYRFNPAEFGIMPSSIDGQEPDQFLALKVARDALVDAGYFGGNVDHTNTGIILGHSTYLHRGQATMVQHGIVLEQTLELFAQLYPNLSSDELARIKAVLKAKLPPFSADTAPGVVPNVMTGRIANRLNLMGPNYLIDAACASSLLAVHSGLEELRSGRSDLILAGGVNASSPAEAFMVFSHLGGLSRSSHIRPFDTEADGTLLGEGLGIVVLKRLDDAQRDGDRIYGLIKTVGQSSDGRALGLLAPRLEGEILAIERAYAQSGIDPSSISLVEAHGTGIPLGDKTEIQALRRVMGDRDGEVPRCALGSVKSMISHCIPAAGIAALIKTTLALYYKVLPPTLCEQPNPELELEKTPFYINTETRPWIHPPAQVRRAAVDAFGFGGINTHAILEEYRGPDAVQAGLRDWASEVAVFVADDRQQLLNRLTAVGDYIEQRGDAPVTLRDIAYSLAKGPREGAQRLAIVASDLDDLLNKMHKAARTLADKGRHRYQTRKGAFFTDQPLRGKLAFVFPGEGAQYPGMLADLAMCFPVVRQWFDFWESVYQGKRDFPTTSSVFPPPTAIDADVRQRIEQRLYSLEIGSESMFITSQALFALLENLGIKPDAMLGHSSGENTALVASGMVHLGDQDQLRAHILRLNEMYQEMESAGEIVTGSLLTVGAVSRDIILEVVEQSAGRLHMALDNCRHQSVLFGPRDAMDQAVERFRKEGGLCAFLPFDRAYHTPLFEPVARTIEKFFEAVDFGEARIPLYSCANAGLYPEQAENIRHHAAIQWSSRVRFTETVEQMYSDGVRFFVEVGPSGNLTSFVNDILYDKEHLAISANNRNRPGLFQLQQLLATLFVHDHNVNLDALFEGRACALLDFDQPAPEAEKPAPLLSNTLPYVRLDAGEIDMLGSILHKYTGVNRSPHADIEPLPDTFQVSQAALGTDPEGMHDELMLQHFDMMQDFLAQQERILSAGLGEPVPGNNEWPFIQRLLEQSPERAVAEFDLDISWQRFLQEHILYSSELSDLDPDLHALPVVPLTASLEMLTEVAGLLATRVHLVALENVRAYNWIALDEGEKTIRLEADRLSGDASIERFHAAIFAGDDLLLEGDILFSDEVPGSEAVLPPLQSPRDPIWQDHELYTTGMFHGPMYHSVRHLLAWDETGIDAELAATPVTGFYDAQSQPSFFLNPVLMDAVGHLTAFWIAQSRGTDFSCFPSRIARIELVNPAEQATEGYRMRGRLAFDDRNGQQGRFLEGNYDCLDLQGRALFRIHGWCDRFFSVPHSFYYGRTNPREGWYGEDWSYLYPDLPDDYLVWNLPSFPAGFLEDAGAVWKRLLVYTLLSREERDIWQTLPANSRRRSEWLMGRMALKEVARRWMADQYGVLLYPADIVIRTDAAGKPHVAADGLESVGAPPQVSLAHAGGYTVAVAGPADRPVGIDLETFGRIRLPDFISGAFTPLEKSHVESVPEGRREEVALRLWCAKEAAAKSLGMGLNGRPSLFEVKELSADGMSAIVHSFDRLIPVSIQREGEKIISLATTH